MQPLTFLREHWSNIGRYYVESDMYYTPCLTNEPQHRLQQPHMPTLAHTQLGCLHRPTVVANNCSRRCLRQPFIRGRQTTARKMLTRCDVTWLHKRAGWNPWRLSEALADPLGLLFVVCARACVRLPTPPHPLQAQKIQSSAAAIAVGTKSGPLACGGGSAFTSHFHRQTLFVAL